MSYLLTPVPRAPEKDPGQAYAGAGPAKSARDLASLDEHRDFAGEVAPDDYLGLAFLNIYFNRMHEILHLGS